MVGKPPRKQRSSRFVITEKVEIEKLPPFMGNFIFILSSNSSLCSRNRTRRAATALCQETASMRRAIRL